MGSNGALSSSIEVAIGSASGKPIEKGDSIGKGEPYNLWLWIKQTA